MLFPRECCSFLDPAKGNQKQPTRLQGWVSKILQNVILLRNIYILIYGAQRDTQVADIVCTYAYVPTRIHDTRRAYILAHTRAAGTHLSQRQYTLALRMVSLTKMGKHRSLLNRNQSQPAHSPAITYIQSTTSVLSLGIHG